MKTIIGALLGCIIGAVVWYFLETGNPPRDASWAPLLIGVLAGAGSRLLDTSPASYLRGALTAAIAIGAMFGARQGITYAVTRDSAAVSEPVQMPDVELPMDEEEEEEDDAEESEIPVVESDPNVQYTVPVGDPNAQRGAFKGQTGLMAVYFAVGALVAYFIGKGKSTDVTATSTASPPPE